jgi:hypothetical protein
VAPIGTTALKELSDELRGFRADFRVFQTKLMGDDKTEDKQGRIPRIEAKLKDHDARIGNIEHLRWAGAGAAWLGGVVVGILGACYYFFGIVRH